MDGIYQDFDTDIVYQIKAGLLFSSHVHFDKQRQNYVDAHPEAFKYVRDTLYTVCNFRVESTNIHNDLSSEGTEDNYNNTNPEFLTTNGLRTGGIDPVKVALVLGNRVYSEIGLNKKVEDEVGPEINNAKLLHFMVNNVGEAHRLGICEEAQGHPFHITRKSLTFTEFELLTFFVLGSFDHVNSHMYFSYIPLDEYEGLFKDWRNQLRKYNGKRGLPADIKDYFNEVGGGLFEAVFTYYASLPQTS